MTADKLLESRHVRCGSSTTATNNCQGRRHGFESWGDNFASGASKKIFGTPHFLASGGQNIA